jgi:hypothetical protein
MFGICEHEFMVERTRDRCFRTGRGQADCAAADLSRINSSRQPSRKRFAQQELRAEKTRTYLVVQHRNPRLCLP